MNTRKILTSLAIVAASIGISGTALAKTPAKPAPLSYTCAVAKAGSLPAACATLPGVWNGWAGRITPVRWDPCMPGSDFTMRYMQACGPMTPTIRQWCTLNFDHRYLGRDYCG